MDLELLQSISCAVSQIRSVDTVLSMIVSGLVDKAGIALARIWLLGPGDLCTACRMRPECPSQEQCLHLVASAGHSQVDGQSWGRLNGEFCRIPLGMRKIGQIGATGESLLLRDELINPAWMVHPDWAEREGIQSIAGHPLMFRGENLGVLGVFSRELISAQQFRWLGVFADQAAVSIANARAFEELDALRVRLELENDYLRSEVKENRPTRVY